MFVDIKEFKKVDSTSVLIFEIVDDKVNVDDIDSLFVSVSSLSILGLLLVLSQELVSKSLLSKPVISVLILQVSGIINELKLIFPLTEQVLKRKYFSLGLTYNKWQDLIV